jgi:RND family efflux transporter MFP subunit
MKRTLKIILPLLLPVLGAGLVVLLVVLRPQVKPAPRETPLPLVRVVRITPVEHRFVVRAQGTVVPHTELQLSAEVAGRVVAVAPSFRDGGFFDRDEVLVRVDPRDYELAVTRAQAQLAEARVRVEREEAEAAVALAEWRALGGDRPANPLVRREPQLAEARALVAAAEAALAQARLDLERCTLRAPFAGRVWQKRVDAGQYVRKGDEVARIYSVDYAEVRLPVPLADLAYVDLPLAGAEARDGGPAVLLSARLGGETVQWPGRVVRTLGEVDVRTRMVTAVARVEDPYGRQARPPRAPLAVGLFVEAEIEGRPAGPVYLIPRAAMRGPDRVMVVDAQERLRLRLAQVVRLEGERVVLRGGVEPGDRVCLSPLDAPVDGMRVRAQEEAP